MSTIPRLINPLMDCWGRAHPREFLFGLQNIVKSKYTLLDCWGGPHPTLEKNVGKKCDKIFAKKLSFFSFFSCELSSVKFVKQITDLSRALSIIYEHLRSYCEHCDVNPSTSQ
ncbi:hypothetical protein T02_7173 [Trichinella nativa]|uniref:Uncharacterized protein n=1 Tax=Trichinella nativa TaxID=6335 RepID=A0A0V1KZZ9_9BILA|nr:hypothetical protein T02_7173 [Trichinella nativa]